MFFEGAPFLASFGPFHTKIGPFHVFLRPFHDYSTPIPRPTFFCDFFNHPNSFVMMGFTGHMFPNLGPPQKRLIMPGGKPDFGPLLFCLGSSALQSRRPFFFRPRIIFFIFFPSRSRGIQGYPHSYGTHITSSPR